MEDPKLYSWTAKRAGGRITVMHSCGKVVGVDAITSAEGRIIALDKNGKTYELVVAALI